METDDGRRPLSEPEEETALGPGSEQDEVFLLHLPTYVCSPDAFGLSGTNGVGCSIETLAELIGDTPKVAFDHYGKEWGQHYQDPLWAAIGAGKKADASFASIEVRPGDWSSPGPPLRGSRQVCGPIGPGRNRLPRGRPTFRDKGSVGARRNSDEDRLPRCAASGTARHGTGSRPTVGTTHHRAPNAGYDYSTRTESPCMGRTTVPGRIWLWLG